MLRTGPLVKGLLSYAFERFRNPHSDCGPGTPEVAYSRFLRFLKLYKSAIPGAGLPRVIAELGPGSSLGFGIAALIAGADRYYALDLTKRFSCKETLETFDQLVVLFQRRAPIPNDGWCARIFPFVDDLVCPDDIIGGEELSAVLTTDRLSRLRRELTQQSGNAIQFIAPWQERVTEVIGKVDWIVSNSVLEHVDDLDSTYRAFASWSKSGTVMCHSIDYSSHTLTTIWNEHWRIGDTLWKLLRGKRHYLINRVPNERHLRYLARYKFKLIAQQKLRRVDGLIREEFSERFRNIHAEDSATHLAFLISKYDGSITT